MKKIMLVVVATAALAGCDVGLIGKAKKLVQAELTDPESAQWQEVELKTMAPNASAPYTPGQKIVCGKVNAKNRMGGYVGFREFYADPSYSARIRGEIDPDFYASDIANGGGYTRACVMDGRDKRTFYADLNAMNEASAKTLGKPFVPIKEDE